MSGKHCTRSGPPCRGGVTQRLRICRRKRDRHLVMTCQLSLEPGLAGKSWLHAQLLFLRRETHHQFIGWPLVCLARAIRSRRRRSC